MSQDRHEAQRTPTVPDQNTESVSGHGQGPDDLEPGHDPRRVDGAGYDPAAALRECLDLWGSGAWPDSNSVANLDEVMTHLERLLVPSEAAAGQG